MWYWRVSVFLSLVASILGSDVLEFNDENFQEKVASHPMILVEFYAPWCAHCKALAPHYEEAATKLKNADPPFPLAKVDCIANKVTCDTHGVKGFPTLKIFKNGEFYREYKGERTTESIVEYMRTKTGPASKEINSEEELSSFLENNKLKTAVIGFFDSNNVEKEAFMKLAGIMSEDFPFAHTSNAALISKYEYENDIVLFRGLAYKSKFEPVTVKYPGIAVEEKVRFWIEKNAFGLCGVRNSENEKYFKEKPIVIAYYDVDYEKNPKGSNYWRNRVMKVASEVLKERGDVAHFAVSNPSQMPELQRYGMETLAPKQIVITALGKSDEKYLMKEDFSVDAFKKWLTDVLDGKEPRYVISQDIPTSDDGHVKVVVAKNFDEIVNNPEKDVLLEFYAPWCGHCKQLAPTYERVAEKLQYEPDLVIAKMDATANDVPPPYHVEGFPTIYFVPKNNKGAPILFDKARDLYGFVNFLAEKSTDGLVGYERDGRPKTAKRDL